jgi:hypothetical protein
MSTFEPMGEEQLTDIAHGSLGALTPLERAARTALHHLARTKAAEEARDLAIAERDEAYRQRDMLASAEAAEAEPAQTFHPPISVTLVSGPDLDHPCAQVKVGLIGDPTFLALSGNDYARLALVVTRG